MSTSAPSLFGLDLGPGLTRYRSLPLRGWQILLAKDLSFLFVLTLLVAPLSPAPGLTFGIWALALGHHSSLTLPIQLHRWRFAAGRLLPVDAMQAIGGIAAGFEEISYGPIIVLPIAVLWCASVYFYGRHFDHTWPKIG